MARLSEPQRQKRDSNHASADLNEQFDIAKIYRYTYFKLPLISRLVVASTPLAPLSLRETYRSCETQAISRRRTARTRCSSGAPARAPALGRRQRWQATLQTRSSASADAQHFCVIRVYRHTALAWPVKYTGNKTSKAKDFAFQMDIDKLQWLFLFDKTSYVVHKLKIWSPSRVWTENRKATGAGIRFSSSSTPVTLESYHTDHAFAGLSEDIMKKMCQDWNIDTPDVPKDMSEVTALQTALVVHNKPGTSAEEVVAKVLEHSGAVESDYSGELVEEVHAVMQDAVVAQDQDKILAILKKSDKAKEARKKNAAAVAKYFDKVVKKLPPAKQTERKKSMAAAAKADKESAAKSSASTTSGLGGSSGSKAAASEAGDSYLHRKYDSLDTAMDDLLRQAEPQVRILSDAENGRWRIKWASEGTTEQRSISWTSVGAKVAAEQTLKQAWEWSATHRGKGMSEKARKILAAIRDYAA